MKFHFDFLDLSLPCNIYVHTLKQTYHTYILGCSFGAQYFGQGHFKHVDCRSQGLHSCTTTNQHNQFEPEFQFLSFQYTRLNFTETCMEYCRIFDRVILHIYILYALMILMCLICCLLPKMHSASLCLSQRTREDNISCAPCVCQHSSNACLPF